MQIPKFWMKASEPALSAQGEQWLLSAWGWSDESEQAAAEVANRRLRAQAAVVAAGRPLDRYAYQDGGRPLREEVLDRPCPGAVITRNRYGARILNTEQIAFVDIDFVLQFDSSESEPGLFARLFGAKRGPSREEAIRMKLDLLRPALRPDRISARAYETHSGMRLLLTDRGFDPASDSTLSLLKNLGCDPLYQSLCRQQECFRARLTPKPWRCGFRPPSCSWPYSGRPAEQAMQRWVERYEAACAPFATTRYLTTLGEPDVHPEVRPVVELHDRLTGADSALPLA